MEHGHVFLLLKLESGICWLGTAEITFCWSVTMYNGWSRYCFMIPVGYGADKYTGYTCTTNYVSGDTCDV